MLLCKIEFAKLERISSPEAYVQFSLKRILRYNDTLVFNLKIPSGIKESSLKSNTLCINQTKRNVIVPAQAINPNVPLASSTTCNLRLLEVVKKHVFATEKKIHPTLKYLKNNFDFSFAYLQPALHKLKGTSSVLIKAKVEGA